MSEFNLDAAIADSVEQAQAELSRGVTTEAMADLGFDGIGAHEIAERTFPRAAGKAADFICGCSVETTEELMEPTHYTDDTVPQGMALVRQQNPAFAAEQRTLPNSYRNATPRYIENRKQILG